ncbi:hypothetical protein AN639_09600 [Candidatus Epulonipiscium fishelsonii]|uniref:Uncharacterized protein n=1 Tax=Candidatus Epulonipiscium fishelsonii TaxID=77094 RepID=A0ACC8XGN3_9FIRM|nr:hypothetical protein AN639_09600 [Epulopiscium sp. SCG-B05WGA-EpuloA1]ONI42576.1 hypothetical protein AN396_14045 [Epulopiscium sp. SCG-B11WGA-EpuloA1]
MDGQELKDIELEIQNTHMKIEKAKNGIDYTMKLYNEYTEKYVLSKYEPRQKAFKNLELNKFNKDTLWIIMGYSLGYGIKKILDYIGEFRNKLIIIEPNEELLNYQMEFEQIDPDKITVFSGMDFDKLTTIFSRNNHQIALRKYCLITDKVYSYFYEKYFKQVNFIFENVRLHEELTYKFFEIRTMEEIEHTISNYNFITNSYSLNDLKQYKNIPAVIVSAGPSLSKNINQLKDFNGLIFVISRTLNAIYNNNIEPDFIFHADSNNVSFDLLKEDACLDYPMICTYHSNYDLMERHKNIKYFVTTLRPMCKALGVELNELSYSISVSSLAISVATYLKCSPIILMGQDLAFTNNEFHDKEAQDEQETQTFKMPDDFIWTKAFDEKFEIKSNNMYLRIKDVIEKFISTHTNIEFINATEGGAYIEGCSHMSLKSVIEKYNPKHKVKIEHVKPSKSNVKIELKDIILELEEVIDLIKSLLDLLTDIATTIKYRNVEDIRINYSKIEDFFDQIQQYTIYPLINILETSAQVQNKSHVTREIFPTNVETIENNSLEEMYVEYFSVVQVLQIDYTLVHDNLEKILESFKIKYRKG